MDQNHFTLRFPLRTPDNAKAPAGLLPPLMPAFFDAQDRIGTIHYSRFTILSEKTLLFLGDFDGEFAALMTALDGAGELHPFLVILPSKSRIALTTDCTAL
jgi:hypothetical protein